MRLSSPLDALAGAVYHAASSAFPDIHYENRDWEAMADWTQAQRAQAHAQNSWPLKKCVRRPSPEEAVVVAMFPQTWGSTALGFGGIGGAAMTPAYTVVVRGPAGEHAVYWAGRFAYWVPADVSPEQREAFEQDLLARATRSVREAAVRYGAVLKPALGLQDTDLSDEEASDA